MSERSGATARGRGSSVQDEADATAHVQGQAQWHTQMQLDYTTRSESSEDEEMSMRSTHWPSSASAAAAASRRASGNGNRNGNGHGKTSGGRHSAAAVGELIAQLQRLCQRQRFRSDERAFVRDVDKIVAQLKQRAPASKSSDTSGASATSSGAATTLSSPESSGSEATATTPGMLLRDRSFGSLSGLYDGRDHIATPSANTVAELNLELLLDSMGDLFHHRYQDVRALAFDVIVLCLTHYGDRLTSSMRQRIFEQLEDAADAGSGDYALRQKALRLLTLDGRRVEPFHVELGWLLLQWLDESDEQRDLLGLIQNIFRRSPLALDFETVVAITSIVCGRCDLAWSRGDIDTCKRFLSFFHVLATHRLEHALGTSVCLRTLCCMVNADGHGTWSVMKHLLNGSAGFQVLRGLVLLLENPAQHSQWVLRGAVFFIGMSCWGSQRVAKLEEIEWAPVLLALESALRCNNGVVIFEIILALQRLMKKYGDGRTPPPTGEAGTTTMTRPPKRITVEWDIILRMLRALRPWLSSTDDAAAGDAAGGAGVNGTGPGKSAAVTDLVPSIVRIRDPRAPPPIAAMAANKTTGAAPHHTPSRSHQVAVPIHLTRIPRELLDTLLVLEELVRDAKYAGEVDEFYAVLEDYLPYLPEASIRLLLQYRAEAAHPAHHADWMHALTQTMETFFSNDAMVPSVRQEALELLQLSLWSSRNICEDRVIEEVLLPMLCDVYDDLHAEIRRRGLDLITEVARHLESSRFDALLDVLENAVLLAQYEDAQQSAIAGVVSLFSSYFDHLPQARALRMYDLITSVVESHRNWKVRRCALECLLRVCEASTDARLQWKDNQVRTSRFLYASRRAVRNYQTGACVTIAHGLRALLTLISTETHAELFRMAVEGLSRMLKNRVILTDVDVSNIAMKIMSCVDYRAFGRAAIPDELAALLAEVDDGATANTHATASGGATTARRSDPWSRTTIDSYVPHLLLPRSAKSTARRHAHADADATLLKSDVRDAAALLCKTRFVAMGLELLELFISYLGELHEEARHQLLICFVGALDNQIMVSDKDLELTPEPEAPPPPPPASSFASSLVPFARVRSLSFGRSTAHHPHGDDGAGAARSQQQASAQSTGYDAGNAESKPVYPHVAFTSRVLSKLNSTAHHGGIFNSLTPSSSSSSSSSTNTRPRAMPSPSNEQHRLHKCMTLLYEAEFALLHTSCNGLSLLTLVMPRVVAARLDLLLSRARVAFQTPDGAFRADAYAAVLELVSNVVSVDTVTAMHHVHILMEIVLLAFRSPVPKATSYLAYHALGEIVFRCAMRERVELARSALPLLQEYAATGPQDRAMLVESAIDFLVCFALSRSLAPAPAARVPTPSSTTTSDVPVANGGGDASSSANTMTATSWVYHNAILTIEMHRTKPAQLIVRRANSTSRWHLAMQQDYVVDPISHAKRNNRHQQPTERRGKDVQPTHRVQQEQQQQMQLTSAHESDEVGMPPNAGRMQPEEATAAVATPTAKPVTPSMLLWKSKASVAALGTTFSVGADHTLPVPPLPAYDGVGGSPSYFCDAPSSELGAMDEMTLTSSADRALGTPSLLADSDDVPPHATEATTTHTVELDEATSDVSLPVRSEVESKDSSSANMEEQQMMNGHESSATDEVSPPTAATSASGAHEGVGQANMSHPDSIDPLYLMMQLFDLTVDNRPLLLKNSEDVARGLKVLDRTPEFETHKIGLLYVRSGRQTEEGDILGNHGGSLRYLRFLRSLGTITKLQGHRGYAAGMDTTDDSDGKYTLLFKSHCLQMVFHVASMMVTREQMEQQRDAGTSTSTSTGASNGVSAAMKKKRHIGNDSVHVVFKECDDEYDVQTFSGQFNDVHIIVQPLNDLEYRTQVRCKPGIAPFGPLYGAQVVPSAILGECVRLTCVNANLACQAFHQDHISFTMNCEERLKQIKQLGARYATSEAWTVGSAAEDAAAAPAGAASHE